MHRPPAPFFRTLSLSPLAIRIERVGFWCFWHCSSLVRPRIRWKTSSARALARQFGTTKRARANAKGTKRRTEKTRRSSSSSPPSKGSNCRRRRKRQHRTWHRDGGASPSLFVPFRIPQRPPRRGSTKGVVGGARKCEAGRPRQGATAPRKKSMSSLSFLSLFLAAAPPFFCPIAARAAAPSRVFLIQTTVPEPCEGALRSSRRKWARACWRPGPGATT